MNSIDSIAYRGKCHLGFHNRTDSLCGKTAPIWYRVPWNEKSEGICKNCIKKLTKLALAEQKSTLKTRIKIKNIELTVQMED